MNTSTAQAVVVTVGAGVLVLGVVDAGLNGKAPTLRRVIGTAAATLGLSLAADATPDLAGRLAVLWGVTTVFTSGLPALTALTKLTAPTK